MLLLAAAVLAAISSQVLSGCGSGSASTGDTSLTTGQTVTAQGNEASQSSTTAVAAPASQPVNMPAGNANGSTGQTGSSQGNQSEGIGLSFLGMSLQGSQDMINTVGRDQQVTVWAKTTGPVDSIIVNIRPSLGGMGVNVDLHKSGVENGLTVWTADTRAPSDPGQYKYSANVFDSTGKPVVNGSSSIQVN